MKTITTIILLTLLLPVTALAKYAHEEKYYHKQWCTEHHGRMKVMLPDEIRADCVTADAVIEFDFGDKWAEAIGRALYYSLQTGKQAGIVLILEDKKDRKYWIRLNSTIQHFNLPIDTWNTGAGAILK